MKCVCWTPILNSVRSSVTSAIPQHWLCSFSGLLSPIETHNQTVLPVLCCLTRSIPPVLHNRRPQEIIQPDRWTNPLAQAFSVGPEVTATLMMGLSAAAFEIHIRLREATQRAGLCNLSLHETPQRQPAVNLWALQLTDCKLNSVFKLELFLGWESIAGLGFWFNSWQTVSHICAYYSNKQWANTPHQRTFFPPPNHSPQIWFSITIGRGCWMVERSFVIGAQQ